MAKVTISEAARLVGVARQNLYKNYINEGKISIERDHLGKPKIDTSELIRVFGEIRMTPENTEKNQSVTYEKDSYDNVIPSSIQAKDEVIATLRSQLDAAADRERKAEEREAWLRQHLDDAQRQIKLLTHDGDSSQVGMRKSWWRFWG
jgi:hypothetical protein